LGNPFWGIFKSAKNLIKWRFPDNLSPKNNFQIHFWEIKIRFWENFWELNKAGKGGRKCERKAIKVVAKNVCFQNVKVYVVLTIQSKQLMQKFLKEIRA